METSDSSLFAGGRIYFSPTYICLTSHEWKRYAGRDGSANSRRWTKKNIPEEAENSRKCRSIWQIWLPRVEMEAVFKEEQPRIAGSFRRSLRDYMPIQSDTTIQYILDSKEEITPEIPWFKTLITLIKTVFAAGTDRPGMSARSRLFLNPENGVFILCCWKRRTSPFLRNLCRAFEGNRRYSAITIRESTWREWKTSRSFWRRQEIWKNVK